MILEAHRNGKRYVVGADERMPFVLTLACKTGETCESPNQRTFAGFAAFADARSWFHQRQYLARPSGYWFVCLDRKRVRIFYGQPFYFLRREAMAVPQIAKRNSSAVATHQCLERFDPLPFALRQTFV